MSDEFKYYYTDVQYLENYDGDTIKFMVDRSFDFGFGIEVGGSYPITVRLFGIDTYELRSKDPLEKKKAKEAKEFVELLLSSADRIHIETFKDRKGKYGRYLAKVRVELTGSEEIMDLGERLVDLGLAVEKEYWGVKSKWNT